MSEFTWTQVFKDIPKNFKEGCVNAYNYWRNAPLRQWVAEITWLSILVAMFYYGIYGIIGFFETTQLDPDSAMGWFVSFLPVYFVVAIFAVHAAYSTIVKTVFIWMDNRG